MPLPIPEWFWLALYALVGLLLGSFANVVIWRFPRGESVVSPGSHCPSCGSPVRWHDNVPVVSWLVLRARCRDCSAPISGRYPLVEALSGSLWLAAAAAFGPGARGLIAAFFFWTLLVLSFIDLDTMRLPNAIVGSLALVGFLGALAAQWLDRPLAPLVGSGRGPLVAPLASAAAGTVLAGGLSLGMAALYAAVRGRSGFGMGDVKLLGAMGPFLGPYALLALMLGSIVGAVAGVGLSVRRRESLARTRIPFGPFLALGGVVAAIAGPAILRWYLGIAGVL